MARLAVALAVCTAVLWAASPALSQGGREAEVLHKLVQAERDTQYIATLITNETAHLPGRDTPRRTKQKLWHGPDGKYRLEPIEPPMLRGNMVIDDGKQTYHIFTRRKAYMVKPSAGSWVVGPMLRRLGAARAPEVRRRIHEFIRGAHVTVTGRRKTIAGREAFALVFDPPPPPEGPPDQPHGPGPRSTLWIDREKSVIVGVEAKTPDGRTLSWSEFESIEFVSHIDPERFAWRPGPDMTEARPQRGRMTVEQASQRMGFGLARPKLIGGTTIAGYLPEPGDAVEIISFEPRGEEDGGPSLPVAVMRFHKQMGDKRYIMELFQSSPRVLARDIPERGLLARKIAHLRRGEWDEQSHSFTWILGEDEQVRLLRLQAPQEMSERKVREIARSVSF